MNKKFSEIGFMPADILLPSNADYTKWSVVACDQYTSEPEYWDQVEQIVGDNPSTLRMMLPEVYLEKADVDVRISKINKTMSDYLADDVFSELKDCFIYVERTLKEGKVRKGLVGMVDLEKYNYHPGSKALIRATEGTVLNRIPPRVKVRVDAPLELPHVMILIDDEKRSVIEPLTLIKDKIKKVYDFDLMQGGGHITGYAVDGDMLDSIASSLTALSDKEYFNRKYDITDKDVMLFAMGDGNHSLATAKECFERLKEKIGEEKALNHPARYALAEIVNVHDEALEFEAIHRVVFGVNPEHILNELIKYYPGSALCEGNGQQISFTYTGKSGIVTIPNPPSELEVGTLQKFLDYYVDQFGGKIDYIHGDDVVRSLAQKDGNIGFILPAIGKSQLFKTVILDGVLPRKTFSMGEASEKRFYLECRKIK